MARLETVTDHICGWPYTQPYVFTRKIPRKKRAPKAPKIKKARKPRTARDL
jgi:hypothetical protein